MSDVMASPGMGCWHACSAALSAPVRMITPIVGSFRASSQHRPSSCTACMRSSARLRLVAEQSHAAVTCQRREGIVLVGPVDGQPGYALCFGVCSLLKLLPAHRWYVDPICRLPGRCAVHPADPFTVWTAGTQCAKLACRLESEPLVAAAACGRSLRAGLPAADLWTPLIWITPMCLQVAAEYTQASRRLLHCG